MYFPVARPRRLRRTETIRRMVRETKLSVDDFIYPLFVTHGKKVADPIPSMPGHFRFSVDNLVKEVRQAHKLGVPAVLLFGIPESKDERGSPAYDRKGVVQTAIRAIKDKVPEICVVTDVCLCEYTSHGHCGLIEGGRILNDPSLELLAEMALSHAEAGADIVAPSDMMDGRVGAIREVLDENGFEEVAILSYAVKYASSFYGPFRDAADSAPSFGNRASYQMDPANGLEALREAAMDVEEGADILMVKPALPYLDVIAGVAEAFDLPLAAYNVSGEFSMVKAAAANGWIDGERVMMEMLTSIKRAGADLILTYFAKEAAELLRKR